ncbi:hypothetical protein [Comamonas sp. wu1-DMT]|uniref:hypothetical protein n=1 Tax=Comamonas sp. wu1-DMT TaxID=3126390 RepID=UPI0032E3CE70
MKRALRSENTSTEMLPSLTADVSAIYPGVTLVAGPYGALSIYFQHVLLLALATASTELPIPMPSCDLITSIHSGTRRQLEMIKWSHVRTGIAAYANSAFKFEYLQASTALNLTSPEMVSRFACKRKSALERSCFLLVMADGMLPIDEGLMELRRLGEANNAYFIVICPGMTLHAKYQAIVTELLVVSQGEPDPGYEEAFTIASPDLFSSFQPSLGKVVCNTRMSDSGLETEITPYVSDNLKTRLMAILKLSGWSMQRIGDLFEMDKSNVSRKLRNVVATIPDGWDDDMFVQWLNACGIDPAKRHGGKNARDRGTVKSSQTIAPDDRNERNTRNEIKPKKKPR